MSAATLSAPLGPTLFEGERPAVVLYVHPTTYRYEGDADPSQPGGITAIYSDLAASGERNAQVVRDVLVRCNRSGTAWS